MGCGGILSSMKIFIAFAIGAIVGLVLSLFAFPARGPESALSPEGQFMAERRAVLEARRADTYGGDTPQETLDLFIAALEKGDTDLAAKYFVVYKQEEIADELHAGQASGGNETQLKVLTTYQRSGSQIGADGYEFQFTVSSNEPPFVARLIRDPESNIWKLESL